MKQSKVFVAEIESYGGNVLSKSKHGIANS